MRVYQISTNTYIRLVYQRISLRCVGVGVHLVAVVAASAMRCELCARKFLPRTTDFQLLAKLGVTTLPASLQSHAQARRVQLAVVDTALSGRVCKGTCARRVRAATDALSNDTRESRRADQVSGSSSRDVETAAPLVVEPQPKRARLGTDASLRFEAATTATTATEWADERICAPWAKLPKKWRAAGHSVMQTVHRPADRCLRAQAWRETFNAANDYCAASGGGVATGGDTVCYFEELQGMAPHEYGPPLLLDARLLTRDNSSFLETGDGYDEAREQLLATAAVNLLHEIEVRGHALDQLDNRGRLLHNVRQLQIDEDSTRWRNPLSDGTAEMALFQRYGWADPDSRHCQLLVHPADVPLLVTQRHEPNSSLAVGSDGRAPVLMYGPAIHKLLAHGHPGRVALEMLQHPGPGQSWLHCKLPLPPDHRMHGWTLLSVLESLEDRGKAYGHGHGYERLVATGTMGSNVSQTWVHPMRREHRHKKARKAAHGGVYAQRPLVSANGCLEWDDASSALQYGTVHACIPAAEAALELLLPQDHPARRYSTRLAPAGRVFTYQAGKWYVSEVAANRFPGLTKYGKNSTVDSFDVATGKARTIEPHFDTGNLYFWGLCIIFGRFKGFEQSYPTIRLLVSCSHLSFAFGPYGQLAHAVAQGDASNDEPRLCVLLHVHGEMTTMPGVMPLRYDMTGFKGCKGEQPYDVGENTAEEMSDDDDDDGNGYICDRPMGFEMDKSKKSQARNEMEMLMRRLPRARGEAYVAPSPAELRAHFVDMCVRGMMAQAAPLLGDVVLLTAMTEDFRLAGMAEGEVREALLADLEARLHVCGHVTTGTRTNAQWREHAYHFQVSSLDGR